MEKDWNARSRKPSFSIVLGSVLLPKALVNSDLKLFQLAYNVAQ